MDLQLMAPVTLSNGEEVMEQEERPFIMANTIAITPKELKERCIIPSFADNESTISHTNFIEAVYLGAQSWLKHETFKPPKVRVSHPVNGRVPGAMGKPAKFLTEQEKTLYYERMMFEIEIPSIRDTVNRNQLNLTIGGVRALNTENLYTKKSEEKFKVFIGFNNLVCLNLCISTDGLKEELRARTVSEIVEETVKLVSNFNAPLQLRQMAEFGDEFLSEHQFAQLVGRSRMYQHLPPKIKKDIPVVMPLSDSQINMVTRQYYHDESFKKADEGGVSLWSLFNLFTGANKSSYIDSFLTRGAGSHTFVNDLQIALKEGSEHWFLQ